MKLHIPSVLAALTTVLTLGLTAPVNAENIEHTQQLLGTRECSECDLSRVGLVYANLSGADLREANLGQANLSYANFSAANLSGANLAGAILYNANLAGADLSGADLSGADLRGAILSGANLQGARMNGANLLGTVGLPDEVATAEMLYSFGLIEAHRGNYRGAIDYYEQVIASEPDFSHAYLARSISRLRLGERVSALEDAQHAENLYSAQGNEAGQQAAAQLVSGIEALQAATEEQEEELRGGMGLGTSVLSLLGSLASLLIQFGLP